MSEYYSGGMKKVPGKTKAQLKNEKREAWKNRHNDPSYKVLGAGYLGTKGNALHNVKNKKKVPDWAGDVGRAHLRNQYHISERGYFEDFK